MEIDSSGYKLLQALESSMKGTCLEFSSSIDIEQTIYTWCYGKSLTKTIIDNNNIENEILIGNYLNLPGIGVELQVFHGDDSNCESEEDIVGSDTLLPGEFHVIERSGVVAMRCCNAAYIHDKVVEELEEEVYIESVDERVACTYSVIVCSSHICDVERIKHTSDRLEMEELAKGSTLDAIDDELITYIRSEEQSGSGLHTSDFDEDFDDIDEEFIFHDEQFVINKVNSNSNNHNHGNENNRNTHNVHVHTHTKSILEEDIEIYENELKTSITAMNSNIQQKEEMSRNTNTNTNTNTNSNTNSNANTNKRISSEYKRGNTNINMNMNRNGNRNRNKTESELESDSNPISRYKENTLLLSHTEQLHYREQVRAMFYHGYNNYMKYALPSGELRPVSCSGGTFDLIKIPYVTLIDTLDTLIIMGDDVEFRNAVHVLEKGLKSFDFDVNVSVFETTIRLLGGLLAAHLFAIDPKLNIYVCSIYM